MTTKPKALFVLKFRDNSYAGDGSYSGSYGGYSDGSYSEGGYSEGSGYTEGAPLHSGLYNSASMVRDMLDHEGIESKLVHVQDNNFIHRAGVDFGATHVIVEAFWVVPEKFDELAKAMPGVQFIVRNHSETPFLANEGIAFGWTMEYLKRPNVLVSCNAPRMLDETRFLAKLVDPTMTTAQIAAKVPYLPNFYPTPDGQTHRPWRDDKEFVDIGCFGAIRPLKNHMLQAIAALKFADRNGLRLRFHTNGGRIEGGGDQVRKNLRNMFDQLGDRHQMVEHEWMPHDQFRRLVASMDFVSQVSFSETFNIVAADAITLGIATVVSREVPFSSNVFHADPTDSEDIARAFQDAYRLKKTIPHFNPSLDGLRKYNAAAKSAWVSFFGNNTHG